MRKIALVLVTSSVLLFGAHTPEGINIQTIEIDGEKIVFDKVPDERGMFPKPFFKNIGPFMNRGFDKISEDSEVLLVNAGLPVIKSLLSSWDVIKDVAYDSDMEYDINPEEADIIIDVELYAVTDKSGKFIRTNLAESMKSSSDYSSKMGAASSLKNAGHAGAGNALGAVAGIGFVMDIFGEKAKWIYKFTVKPKTAQPYTVMVLSQSKDVRSSALLMGKVLKNDLLKDD